MFDDNTPWLPGMKPIGRKRKKIVEMTKDAGLGSLQELIRGKIDLGLLEDQSDGAKKTRIRVFDGKTTFLLFLFQVMGGLSCVAMVKHLQALLMVKDESCLSSSSSAYCQARGRLELSVLNRIFDSLSSFLSRSIPTTGGWHGFQVCAVDGTKVDLPDTPANLKSYPKGGAPKKRRGKKGIGREKKGAVKTSRGKKPAKDLGGLLPKMNLTAVFDLFTGGALAWEHGSERVGEQTLWRRLLARVVRRGVLMLGDAYYCSFGNFVEVLSHGGHATFLAKDGRIFHGRGRSAKDFIVKLQKPKIQAKGWTKAKWRKSPNFVELRVVSGDIQRHGFRTKRIRVVSTLLDKELYPAEELLKLHALRWNAELCFRDLKVSMGMDTLRCKTPEMIKKELVMHMIALNLVRALSIDAANISGVNPASVSFVAALEQSARWMRLALDGGISAKNRRSLSRMFMTALADSIVVKRPGRSEPRVIKKRPRQFSPMKTARSNHKEHFNPRRAA